MTPKQALFVQEFLVDLNGTQAAIRAGYSEKTAKEQAAQILARPEIAAAINAAMADRADKLEITAERVLSEIATMAFYDPSDLMIDGEAEPDADEAWVIEGRIIHGLRNVADIKRLPENVRRAIVGWHWDKAGNFVVKLADKSKALDQLARHLSLYNDKLMLGSVDGLADRLARADARQLDTKPAAAPVMAAAPVKSEPAPVSSPDAGTAQSEAAAALQNQPASAPKASQPVEDWAAPKPQSAPVYRPILPDWPDSPNDVEVDYDPTGGAYDFKR